MALVTKNWELSVVLSDQGGNKSALKYDLDPAVVTDYATAASTRSSILGLLDPVTNSTIVAHSLAEKYGEDADFFGTGENENVALIVAKIADGLGKTVNIRIPNPVDGMFQAAEGPDYNEVDPSDSDLVDYLGLFEGFVFVSDGEHIEDSATAGNFYGKRIHRGSRKG